MVFFSLSFPSSSLSLSPFLPLSLFLFLSFSLLNSSIPFYKIIVPTVDTLRYNFLVHNLVLSGRPVLLVGPVGSGKTTVIQSVLGKLDQSEYNQLTINLSAQVRRIDCICVYGIYSCYCVYSDIFK